MIQDQLKTLISLAKIDGIFSKDEIALIYKIALLKGVSRTELHQLLVEEVDIHPARVEQLSEEECFDYLYTIVQLVKIDHRLYREEMHFCRIVVEKLGYNDEVLFYFLQHVNPYEDEKNRLECKKYVASIPLKSKKRKI